VVDFDQGGLTQDDGEGYTRYAFSPPRPAPHEGKGWAFAAGPLAMSASDLARWDIAMCEQRLLSAASYREMETAVLLKNGAGAQYGLGVDISTEADRRTLQHDGAVSGFSAGNVVFPDDKASIAILTNDDGQGVPAAWSIYHRLTPLLFSSGEAPEARARGVFESLQRGKIERGLFSENGAAYFSPAVLADFAKSLRPLGAASSFKQTSQSERGGMTTRNWSVACKDKRLSITERDLPNGTIEEFTVSAEN
jgi:D-alanyl-D-alanine carboxypeptidase